MVFLAGRLIRAALTMAFVVTMVFFASRFSGDPILIMFPEGLSDDEYLFWERYFGLNESLFSQYLKYVRGLFEGNFGMSLTEFRPVTEIYGERIGNTLWLFGSAFLVSLIVGIPLGIYSAVYRRSAVSTGIMALAFFGYAIPNYILAILLILIFSFTLHLFPSSGDETWLHFVMPVFALAFAMMAGKIRFTRSAMLEVLNEDYVRTARAKGLSETLVICKHALKNASIPIVSVLGLQVAGFVGAVVIVEAVFAIPGIGELVVRAAIFRDFAVLQFGVIVWAFVVIAANLIVDLAYAVLDPRVRITA